MFQLLQIILQHAFHTLHLLGTPLANQVHWLLKRISRNDKIIFWPPLLLLIHLHPADRKSGGKLLNRSQQTKWVFYRSQIGLLLLLLYTLFGSNYKKTQQYALFKKKQKNLQNTFSLSYYLIEVLVLCRSLLLI